MTHPILSYTLGRRLGMAVACREEHVGGAHPKKIKRSRCVLLVACCLWIYLASQEFSSLVPMLAKLGRRLRMQWCVYFELALMALPHTLMTGSAVANTTTRFSCHYILISFEPDPRSIFADSILSPMDQGSGAISRP